MSNVTIERQWQAHGLDCVVLRVEMGYGPGHRCGYARVPENHPFYRVAYNEASPVGPADYEGRTMDDAGMGGMIAMLGGEDGVERWAGRVEAHIGVHGGLTFSAEVPTDGLERGWWFGFDCAHADDSPAHWTEDRVALETERMAEQLAALGVTA